MRRPAMDRTGPELAAFGGGGGGGLEMGSLEDII